MIWKTKYLLPVILFLTSFAVTAQNSQVLYFMNMPQNHLLNPALRPSNSTYIGLPVLTGVNVDISNNFFNFSDIFVGGVVRDSLITVFHPDYDPEGFMDKIRNVNSLQPEVLVQLFGLGFTVGKDNYISLDINDRVEGNVTFPGDFIRLAFEGNEQFAGKTIDLSSARSDAKYFREIGFGFSKNFTNALRIGARAKALFGIASASVDNNSWDITVNDDYTHTFRADLVANFSAPVNFYLSGQNNVDSVGFDDSRFDGGGNVSDYLLETQNFGLGIDLGAEYKISEALKVSAAITDLGYIKWKKDISNLKAKSEFVFSGVDLLDVYNGTMTFDSLGTILLDSLKNSFYLTDNNSPFTTYLPMGVTLAGSYALTRNLSVGLVSRTKFIGKQVMEALTLSANANLGNIFSATLAYTAMNHRFDNLGLGLAIRAGCFQFYVMADRIPLTWNRITDNDTNIIIPSNWNTLQTWFGMNLVFGNKTDKKKDKPMIVCQ